MKRLNIFHSPCLVFYKPDLSTYLPLALKGSLLPAGFPSPADDYLETQLDLNDFLVKNPTATFFAKVKGNSMEGAGIFEGDVLIVDRSEEVLDNQIAVCIINGEFTVKRVCINTKGIVLLPENREYASIAIKEKHDFLIWGKVTFVLHRPD